MNLRVAVPLFFALTAFGCKQNARPAPPSVPVTVAKAEERPVPFEITAPGTVEPIRAVAVASQVSGLVTGVNFQEGDEVTAGQILFRIDSRSYRNALQQAQAALARDLGQLQNAQRQVDRYQSLARSEYVTDEQYQALKTTAEGLVATVQSDSAAVDNAKLNLENTTIRAPISGRTGSLLIKEGNLVRAPGSGAMVLLNQTKPIQVRFAVPASYLPEIRQRQQENLKVRVSLNDGRPPLTGELAFVDNAVDTTTGTIMLKGRFENADGALWPGQFVTATLVLYVQNSVVVPAPAVMNGERGPYVFVVSSDQKASTRPVEVGRTVEDVVIVIKGVSLGETIVTDGQLRLTPNAKVEIKTEGGDGAAPPAPGRGPGGEGAPAGGGGNRRGGQDGRESTS
ncbi:MAG: efflux RND transporter periplasmic adaptor subunit [Gemmatimonadetes bacterium]|nr:efflux RND transporter periplasmic adaptor subunit [Gemmatimonadota bacterium]